MLEKIIIKKIPEKKIRDKTAEYKWRKKELAQNQGQKLKKKNNSDISNINNI